MSATAEPRRARIPIVVAVAAIAALAALARAAVDFATPLVPKVKGAYYLVQVRALLEGGRLAFADFPFVFLLEAGLAKMLAGIGVGGGSVEAAIVAAVKLVDVVLPALAAVPVAVIALRLRAPGDERRWPALVAAAVATLSYAPVVMTGDLQKNALGMLAMAALVAAGHAALARGGAWRWAAAVAALAVTGLAHAGAFAAAAAYAVIAGCIAVAVSRPGRWRAVLAAAAIAAGAIALLAAVLWATDRSRFARFAGVLLDPRSLFRRPMLVAVFDGTVGPLDLANALLASAVGALGLAMIVRRWSALPGTTRAIVGASSLLALLLGSPLVGADWAERFTLMAYLPASVALAFVLAHTRRRSIARATAGVARAACAAALALTLGPLGRPSIDPTSVPELQGASALIARPTRTLVIARHGLEWWAAWFLRTRVAQEFDLEPSVWDEYDEVFCLVQKTAPPGPGGPKGAGARSFPEVRLSDDALVVYDGQHFVLALAPTPPSFYPLSRPER